VTTEYDYDVLAIRRRLGRDRWGPPHPGPGPAGVTFRRSDGLRGIIVSSGPVGTDGTDETVWLHASIAASTEGARPPDYWELVELHHAVWGEHGWAFQVFAPPAGHVNIHPNALHLWGLLDGTRIHPDFGWAGTI
jgi:hypothetical protein